MVTLLITVLVILVVCGAFAMIFKYAPIPSPFKEIGVWLSLVVAVFWIIYALFDGWRFHWRLP